MSYVPINYKIPTSPTGDAVIDNCLNVVASEKYGKDIRWAIHDGMAETYNKLYPAEAIALEAKDNADEAIRLTEYAAADMEQAHIDAAEAKATAETANSRVDNLILHNTDTSQNSELIDIRTTYEGTVYSAAGSAVRGQITELSQRIDSIAASEERTLHYNDKAGIICTKIWTNYLPSESFAGIQVNISTYDVTDITEFLIKYRVNADDENNIRYARIAAPMVDSTTDTAIEISQKITEILYGQDGVGYITASRMVSVNTGTIAIDACSRTLQPNPFSGSDDTLAIVDPEISEETVNTMIVPVEIYAVYHELDTDLDIPKDPEILDGRVGIDGVIYSSIGDAIRMQTAKYIGSAVIDAINASY